MKRVVVGGVVVLALLAGACSAGSQTVSGRETTEPVELPESCVDAIEAADMLVAVTAEDELPGVTDDVLGAVGSVGDFDVPGVCDREEFDAQREILTEEAGRLGE